MILIFLHIILDFLRYYKKNLHAAENFLPGGGGAGNTRGGKVRARQEDRAPHCKNGAFRRLNRRFAHSGQTERDEERFAARERLTFRGNVKNFCENVSK